MERYSIACEDHKSTDTRFWGEWFDTYEQAAVAAAEASNDHQASGLPCVFRVRPESERPVLTAQEADILYRLGGPEALLMADVLPSL
jgi:hypothetical protein